MDILRDIDSFNDDCIAWLKRTGNAEEHGTTKKIPAEVFALEKEYLLSVPCYSFTTANESITYQVRKDNIVLYKGNRYRVPKGTYCPGKKVYMVVENDMIAITDCLTGEIYATHPLCHEKGMLIGQKRTDRDKSKSILEQVLSEKNEEQKSTRPALPKKYQGNQVEVRDLSVYEEAMGRSVVNG